MAKTTPNTAATPMRFQDSRESDFVNLTRLYDDATVFTLSEISFAVEKRTGADQLRAVVHDATTGERVGQLWTTGVIVVDQMRSFLANVEWDFDTIIGPLTVGKGEAAYYLSDAS